MKKFLKNETVLSLTLVLGLAAAFAHRHLMTTGIDSKGLLIPNHPLTLTLWALCGGFVLLALWISRQQKVCAGFEAHYPPCRIRGALGIAGGIAVAFSGAMMLKSSQPLIGGAALAAGVCMALAGLCRLLGKRPTPLFHCVVCIFFIINLVLSFRSWSADPQLQDYVLPLMASLSLMLFAYHRASSDADIMTPRRSVFFSLCAAFFCLAALSDETLRPLYLGAGAWAAGAAPTVEIIEQPTEEEPEEEV